MFLRSVRKLLQTKRSGNVSLHKVVQTTRYYFFSVGRVRNHNVSVESSVKNQYVVQETTHSCLARDLWPPVQSTAPARATQRVLPPTAAG